MTATYTFRKGWYKTFLAELSSTANITRSCASAGVSKQTAYHAKEQDTEFAQAWEEAISDAADALHQIALEKARAGSDFWLDRMLKTYHQAMKNSDPLVSVNVDARTQTLELTGPVTADALAKALTLLAEVKAIHLNGHVSPGTAETS